MKNKCNKTDYYETPPQLFFELNKEFHFDLDVCATAENTKCSRFLSEKDNALDCDWSNYGKVIFCNPPYSKTGMKDAFIEKAVRMSLYGCTTVMIIPAAVNTKAFHKWIWDQEHHSPRQNIQIRFPSRRISFYYKGKKSLSGTRNNIMIVVFNSNKKVMEDCE